MFCTAAALCSATVLAQDVSGSLSLKSVRVPGPSPEALAEFVRDKNAAIALGKALFWDTRVGSDSKTACASCHFTGGADNRTKNQVDPGLLRRFPNLADGDPDHTFQLGGAPNYTLRSADFPFTKHADINDASSRIADVNDVASSQGVLTAIFKDVVGKSTSGITLGNGKTGPDVCDVVSDAVLNHGDGFNVNGVNTRRVEPRNTPTMINAVYNFRNFWDGRANNVFNGADPFGLRNPSSLVWKTENGVLREVPVALASSSLASQASGPPLSSTEMSCRSRTFAKLGQKMLGLKILGDQAIAGNDSVLAQFTINRPDYGTLVRLAFQPAYWQSPKLVRFDNARARKVASMDLKDPRPFDLAASVDVNQIEANFSLFFSLAVQLYESTLIANDTPFDQHEEGKSTLTPQQLAGFEIFKGKGHCINCHSGAELTSASFRNVIDKRLEKMVMGNGSTKTYDSGFYNIGVRPTTDDVGVGGTDGFGNPLSESMMFATGKASLLGNNFDPSRYDPTTPENVNVFGAFKTPGLRNVELTGPYFHNGGKATLMQVVDFYNRGGDFANVNRANLDPDIEPLHLSDSEKESLVAFLLSLTDERVRYQRAPFDHPSICLPHGHPGDTKSVTNNGRGEATDINPLLCIKEVGASGSDAPLKTFLGLPPNQH